MACASFTVPCNSFGTRVAVSRLELLKGALWGLIGSYLERNELDAMLRGELAGRG
jgi:hypothetical protein